jgi:hypothetical protein
VPQPFPYLEIMFWKRRESSSSVIGKWMGRVNGAPVALEFRDDGRLAYVALAGGGQTQVMRLTYRIEGNTLVTDQPSQPRDERSEFHLEGDVLSIVFAGKRTEFLRQE